jgi:hypothetical protein
MYALAALSLTRMTFGSNRPHPLRVLATALALLLPTLAGACAKKNADEAPDAAPSDDYDAGVIRDASDADVGVDAQALREEEERQAWLDAGRFCGAKGMPDCPMQEWMKQHASSMIGFGDISAVAQVFDQIAKLVPSDALPDGGPVYTNWVSISIDGAEAARAGDLAAAKAACRGCHTQYRSKFHIELRGKPLAKL